MGSLRPQDEQALAESYSRLMDEIKIRVDVIHRALAGTTGLPSAIVRELCYLQLRMIYELIALSCLVAHGDINTSKLNKSYEPDTILRELSRLRPNFFPSAVKATQLHERAHFETRSDKQYLSKDVLIKMHGKCGNYVHRGSLKTLLKINAPIESNYSDIRGALNAISDLLSVHLVSINEQNKVLICIMSTSDNDGKVNVAVASRATDNLSP